MITSSYVYMNKEGFQEGPVSLESLRYLISTGKLDERTLVSDGMDAWAPAGTYPPTMGMFSKVAPVGSTRKSVAPRSSKGGVISLWKGTADFHEVEVVALCLKIVAVLPILIDLILVITYAFKAGFMDASGYISMDMVAYKALFKMYLFVGLPSAIFFALLIYGFASMLLMMRSLVRREK